MVVTAAWPAVTMVRGTDNVGMLYYFVFPPDVQRTTAI
jgi:hypothetical protein